MVPTAPKNMGTAREKHIQTIRTLVDQIQELHSMHTGDFQMLHLRQLTVTCF
jgi:hypothetical protein